VFLQSNIANYWPGIHNTVLAIVLHPCELWMGIVLTALLSVREKLEEKTFLFLVHCCCVNVPKVKWNFSTTGKNKTHRPSRKTFERRSIEQLCLVNLTRIYFLNFRSINTHFYSLYSMMWWLKNIFLCGTAPVSLIDRNSLGISFESDSFKL